MEYERQLPTARSHATLPPSDTHVSSVSHRIHIPPPAGQSAPPGPAAAVQQDEDRTGKDMLQALNIDKKRKRDRMATASLRDFKWSAGEKVDARLLDSPS